MTLIIAETFTAIIWKHVIQHELNDSFLLFQFCVVICVSDLDTVTLMNVSVFDCVRVRTAVVPYT